MCIYDNVLVFEWYFVIFKAGHFEKLFFDKRYNCGNFSLEYYVKSNITSEYSLIPFSCKLDSVHLGKSNTNFIWEWPSIR